MHAEADMAFELAGDADDRDVAVGVDALGQQQAAKAEVGAGGGGKAQPAHRVGVARHGVQVGAQHQQPVHALGERAEQLRALPVREHLRDTVRPGDGEVDLAVAQRLQRQADG